MVLIDILFSIMVFRDKFSPFIIRFCFWGLLYSGCLGGKIRVRIRTFSLFLGRNISLFLLLVFSIVFLVCRYRRRINILFLLIIILICSYYYYHYQWYYCYCCLYLLPIYSSYKWTYAQHTNQCQSSNWVSAYSSHTMTNINNTHYF